MDDLEMDYSFLFSTPSPGSRPATKMKPNTQFLRNIVSSANSHNAALLAKETAESRARLRRLDGRDSDDQDDRRRRRDRHRSSDKRTHRDRDRNRDRSRDRSRDHEDANRHRRKRTRTSREYDDEEEDGEKQDDRRRRHSHRSRRREDRDRSPEDRDHKRQRRRRDDSDSDGFDEEDRKDYRDRKHRQRPSTDRLHKTSSRPSRHRSRSPDRDRRRRRRTSSSRSRSPAETREERDHRKKNGKSSSRRERSPLGSQLDRKMKEHKLRSHRSEDEGRLKASTPSEEDLSRRPDGSSDDDSYSGDPGSALEDDQSDVDGDDFGPRLASDAIQDSRRGIRIKGRGAQSGSGGGSASMDRHFASTYDPRADVDELLRGVASAHRPPADQAPPGRPPLAKATKAKTAAASASVPTTEDARRELAQDRQQSLREGAERLRKAGFTDKEIAIWARGGKRRAEAGAQRAQNSASVDGGKDEDIKYAAKGTAREWDRDKVAGEDGRPRPTWARD